MNTWRYLPAEPGRRRSGPGWDERAGELASGLLGSWVFLGVVLLVVAVAAAFADLHDRGEGAVAALEVIVPGVALAAVSLVLMATRRADRAAGERALRHLEATQRTQAAGQEILGELHQLNSSLARLAARVELLNVRCWAAGVDRRRS
jgi:hypothetical protein